MTVCSAYCEELSMAMFFCSQSSLYLIIALLVLFLPAGDNLDAWNPMAEDYNDRSFNSYDRGPGRNMPANPMCVAKIVQRFMLDS